MSDSVLRFAPGPRRAPAIVILVATLGMAACGGTGGGTTTSTGLRPSNTTSSDSAASPTAPSGARDGVPGFSHVIVVVMENLGASEAMAEPSIAAVARRYQWTTQWYALSHPSLPNYLGLVSGTTWAVQSDCTACYQRGPDLASELSAAGIGWGAYFEGMPEPCFLGTQSPDGAYAQKHDPFAYFDDVRDDPALCAHLQPLGTLTTLLGGPAAGVPRFVWVTPSMCHSGHDCPASTAGSWLDGFVRQVTASRAWRSGGLLVVTWDEGDGSAGVDPSTGALVDSGGGAVLTIVATASAAQGRRLRGPYSHYSLLRTVEDALGLAYLGASGERGVRPMTAFFAAGG